MNATTRLAALILAVSWVAGCASTQSSSRSTPPPLPSPTSSPSSMPSMPSPSTSPSSRPSPPASPSSSSRSSSSSSSSSSGNPGQTGAPTPGTTPGPSASQPGGAQADAPTPTGGQNDLEVLEPEPLEEIADADPTWEESNADGGAEGGGSEGQAGAEGEMASADGGASGGAAGGGQPAGQAAGGPAGQPGAQGGAQVATAGGIPGGGEGLDQELNRSLEIFDSEMQRTITILASARGGGEGDLGGGGLDPESGEGGGPTDQTGGGSGLILVDGDPSKLPGGDNSGEPVDAEDGTQIARAGNRSGMRGGGSSRNEAYPRIPADVGDGSDDDVVARQIREAALNESDPVLREKLWQEYRNYKKSIK